MTRTKAPPQTVTYWIREDEGTQLVKFRIWYLMLLLIWLYDLIFWPLEMMKSNILRMFTDWFPKNQGEKRDIRVVRPREKYRARWITGRRIKGRCMTDKGEEAMRRSIDCRAMIRRLLQENKEREGICVQKISEQLRGMLRSLAIVNNGTAIGKWIFRAYTCMLLKILDYGGVIPWELRHGVPKRGLWYQWIDPEGNVMRVHCCERQIVEDSTNRLVREHLDYVEANMYEMHRVQLEGVHSAVDESSDDDEDQDDQLSDISGDGEEEVSDSGIYAINKNRASHDEHAGESEDFDSVSGDDAFSDAQTLDEDESDDDDEGALRVAMQLPGISPPANDYEAKLREEPSIFLKARIIEPMNEKNFRRKWGAVLDMSEQRELQLQLSSRKGWITGKPCISLYRTRGESPPMFPDGTYATAAVMMAKVRGMTDILALKMPGSVGIKIARRLTKSRLKYSLKNCNLAGAVRIQFKYLQTEPNLARARLALSSIPRWRTKMQFIDHKISPIIENTLLPIKLFDKKLDLDFITKIVSMQAGDIVAVCGPAATGKTRNLIELARQFLLLDHIVVVVSPTNSSIADLAHKIERSKMSVLRYESRGASKMQNDDLELKSLLSQISHIDQLPAIEKDACGLLLDWLNSNPDDEEISAEKMKEIEAARVLVMRKLGKAADVIVSTVQMLDRVIRHLHGGIQFGSLVVLVDEAAKESMTNLFTVANNANRIVLVGDFAQGPPFSSLEPVSLLESLIAQRSDELLIMRRQYRQIPELSIIPRNKFYGGLVTDGQGIVPKYLNAHPMRCIHVSSTKAERGDEGDLQYACCKNELTIVEHVLRDIFSNPDVEGQDIGIICYYRKQLLEARELLKQLSLTEKRCELVRTDTVDGSQSEEYRILIICATAPFSSEHMRAPFRLNVALTRAQDSLIIIYDAVVLNTVDMWNRFSRSVRLERGIEFVKRVDTEKITLKINPEWAVEAIKEPRTGLPIILQRYLRESVTMQEVLGSTKKKTVVKNGSLMIGANTIEDLNEEDLAGKDMIEPVIREKKLITGEEDYVPSVHYGKSAADDYIEPGSTLGVRIDNNDMDCDRKGGAETCNSLDESETVIPQVDDSVQTAAALVSQGGNCEPSEGTVFKSDDWSIECVKRASDGVLPIHYFDMNFGKEGGIAYQTQFHLTSGSTEGTRHCDLVLNCAANRMVDYKNIDFRVIDFSRKLSAVKGQLEAVAHWILQKGKTKNLVIGIHCIYQKHRSIAAIRYFMMKFQLFRMRRDAFDYINKYRPNAEYLFPNLDKDLEENAAETHMMSITTLLPKDYDGLHDMSLRITGGKQKGNYYVCLEKHANEEKWPIPLKELINVELRFAVEGKNRVEIEEGKHVLFCNTNEQGYGHAFALPALVLGIKTLVYKGSSIAEMDGALVKYQLRHLYENIVLILKEMPDKVDSAIELSLVVKEVPDFVITDQCRSLSDYYDIIRFGQAPDENGTTGADVINIPDVIQDKSEGEITAGMESVKTKQNAESEVAKEKATINSGGARNEETVEETVKRDIKPMPEMKSCKWEEGTANSFRLMTGILNTNKTEIWPIFAERKCVKIVGRGFLCDEDSIDLLMRFDDIEPLKLAEISLHQWRCNQMAVGIADRLGATGLPDTGSTASACMIFQARREGLQVNYILPYASGDWEAKNLDLAGELLSVHLRRLCSGSPTEKHFEEILQQRNLVIDGTSTTIENEVKKGSEIVLTKPNNLESSAMLKLISTMENDWANQFIDSTTCLSVGTDDVPVSFMCLIEAIGKEICILDTMQKLNVKSSLRKFEFAEKQVEVLGFIFRGGRMIIKEKKQKAVIQEWDPIPISPAMARSYKQYLAFIHKAYGPHWTDIAYVLQKSIGMADKDFAEYAITDEFKEAIINSRKFLRKCELAYPDWDQIRNGDRVACGWSDASGQGLGGIWGSALKVSVDKLGKLSDRVEIMKAIWMVFDIHGTWAHPYGAKEKPPIAAWVSELNGAIVFNRMVWPDIRRELSGSEARFTLFLDSKNISSGDQIMSEIEKAPTSKIHRALIEMREMTYEGLDTAHETGAKKPC